MVKDLYLLSSQNTKISTDSQVENSSSQIYYNNNVLKKDLIENNISLYDKKQREFNELFNNNTPPPIDFKIKEKDEPIENIDILVKEYLKLRDEDIVLQPQNLITNSPISVKNISPTNTNITIKNDIIEQINNKMELIDNKLNKILIILQNNT